MRSRAELWPGVAKRSTLAVAVQIFILVVGACFLPVISWLGYFGFVVLATVSAFFTTYRRKNWYSTSGWMLQDVAVTILIPPILSWAVLLSVAFNFWPMVGILGCFALVMALVIDIELERPVHRAETPWVINSMRWDWYLKRHRTQDFLLRRVPMLASISGCVGASLLIWSHGWSLLLIAIAAGLLYSMNRFARGLDRASRLAAATAA